MRSDNAVPRTEEHGPGQLEVRLEQHRIELTGYCYRMLGSAFEAEDAVQETFLRAWRSFERFEGRAALRSWLYRIATNVCLDLLKSRRRRAHPTELAAASTPGAPIGVPLPERAWVEPIPDSRALEMDGDPAEVVAARESIRLAFVAALQHLPPRQRAVLILREVLRWKASEVAELLGTTVASVNSALQRARGTLADREAIATDVYDPMDERQRTLLARYIDAFERDDVETMVSLLHEDATMSMPPFKWWLRGRDDIRRALLGSDGTCHGSRFLPVSANGSPAFGQYIPKGPGGSYKPWALLMIDTAGDRINGMTTFLDPARLFPLFDLPSHLERGGVD